MKASRHVDAPVLQTLEPYPEMKNSGVPALGNKPVHWQVLRVKNLCRMRSGDGITSESITPVGAYPVYGGNGQRGYTSEYTHDGTFVLIGRQGALCGNVHLARGRFWASEHAVVTTVRSGYLPEWLGAILAVMDLNQYSIAAAQPGLSVERVLDLRLPVPPVSEQAAIVRFLDHADRRIRRYIRAKQKLITLLEEQKQAIIHRAVTRGLDPNVRLKPSGVEWLGDVPEHWTLKRFKFLVQITSGQVDPRRPEYRGKILVAPNHIRSSTGEIVHLETAEDQGADSGKYEVRRGQVIYSKIRPNLRKAAIAPCSALGFLDSGLTVFASTLPRPARRGHVAPGRGFDSGTSLASTARCTSA